MQTKKAVFQQDGTKNTDRLCRNEITLFGTEGDRAEQFEMVRNVIIDDLWRAVTFNFGYPKFEKE